MAKKQTDISNTSLHELLAEVNQPKPAPPSSPAPTFLPDLSDDELLKLSSETLSRALQAIDPAKEPDRAVRLSNAILAQIKERDIAAVVGSLVDEAELANHSAEVNIDLLVRKLEAARKLAMKNGEPAAATAAIMGMAKLHGLLVDKREMAFKRPEEMTERELLEALGFETIEQLMASDEQLLIENQPIN